MMCLHFSFKLSRDTLLPYFTHKYFLTFVETVSFTELPRIVSRRHEKLSVSRMTRERTFKSFLSLSDLSGHSLEFQSQLFVFKFNGTWSFTRANVLHAAIFIPRGPTESIETNAMKLTKSEVRRHCTRHPCVRLKPAPEGDAMSTWTLQCSPVATHVHPRPTVSRTKKRPLSENGLGHPRSS